MAKDITLEEKRKFIMFAASRDPCLSIYVNIMNEFPELGITKDAVLKTMKYNETYWREHRRFPTYTPSLFEGSVATEDKAVEKEKKRLARKARALEKRVAKTD